MISFAVITKNQERTIENTLVSIFNLQIQDSEVLVIDDNSTDNTRKIARKYTDKVLKKKDLEEGISNSRNLAIKRAKGSLLFIIDGDIEVQKLNIEKIEELFKKRPNVIALCGKYYTYKNRRNLNYLLDIRRKVIFNKNNRSFEIKFSNYTTFSGGFCCINLEKKNLLLPFVNKVGHSAEDLIWQVELMQLGYTFYYYPKFIGLHNHFRDLKVWPKKIISEIKGNYWFMWYFTFQSKDFPILEQVTTFPIFLFLSIILVKVNLIIALLFLLVEFTPVFYPLIHKEGRNRDTLILMLYGFLNKIITFIYLPISLFKYKPNPKYFVRFLYKFVYSGIYSKFKSLKGFILYVN